MQRAIERSRFRLRLLLAAQYSWDRKSLAGAGKMVLRCGAMQRAIECSRFKLRPLLAAQYFLDRKSRAGAG
ncbi:hypothetical protein NDU88_010080 [Pleurodeles waltl]|uniref:Uncharacterized protein n=1 Tax=Pleurodeles waltl TaxID=8319 RepID=A0AAV7QTE6_PLEWA|nr:hypothetical protein NDU88_010080 [Pleurodeles waltl]